MSEYEEPYLATQKDKRRIVKDWQKQFPGFHIKGNTMLKIHLPVCVGICIYYGRHSFCYVPTFFINNLTTSHYGTLNVCQRCLGPPQMADWWMYISEHDQLFRSAGDWLMENFRVFLEDKPIHLSSLIQAFQKQVEGVKYPNTQTLKDLAYLNGYFSRFEESEIYINRAIEIIESQNDFNRKITLSWENVNSVSEWEVKIRNECSSPDLLHARVLQRIAEAKLDKIPNRPLIVD